MIVGAGWIGCEAAPAAARSGGAQVTVVEPRSQPLLTVVGEQIGATFAALHRDHGVDLRLGVGVKGFAGDGTASAVLIKGGHSIPADTILIGVGAANIALADAAGLTLADGGIAVDATLRVPIPTSTPPAMWRPMIIRSIGAGYGWSTGLMPRIEGCMWRATCWGTKLRTSCDRSSSPTSTTSAASIAGSPTPRRTGSSCVEIGVSGVHSGSGTGPWRLQ